MSLLPVSHNDPASGLSPRKLARAQRAHEDTELAIYQHGLRAMAASERDRRDSQAVADAAQTSLEAEFDVLDYGMARAGQSAARVNLVAAKVELLSRINSRRLARRFGA
jgi:hypothetical protein